MSGSPNGLAARARGSGMGNSVAPHLNQALAEARREQAAVLRTLKDSLESRPGGEAYWRNSNQGSNDIVTLLLDCGTRNSEDVISRCADSAHGRCRADAASTRRRGSPAADPTPIRQNNS